MKFSVLKFKNFPTRAFSTFNNRLASKSFSEHFTKLEEIEREYEVEDIKITLPNNLTIGGKWWGNKSVRPFLCLHGWQDNAGTFDRLIPLLPRNHSYLAIDLLGHGKSSRLPNGLQYHTIDNLNQIHDLCEIYNWEKVSLIGHSLGGILSFLFASIFPNNVDMLIGIDGLKPTVNDPAMVSKRLEDRIKNFMLADKRNREKIEPPSYSLEDMAEKLSVGTRGSIPKELAHYLLRRNVIKSQKFDDKFYFARDARLKYSMMSNIHQTLSVELAKRINVPYLALKANKGPYFENKEHHLEVVNVLKEQNKNFDYRLIDSTYHHLHLVEPEKIAGIMSAFIEKHRK